MVVKKDPPRLRGRMAVTDHVLAHARLADVDIQLEQFPVNPWCAPERIIAAHFTNQRSNFLGHSGAPRPAFPVEFSRARTGGSPGGANQSQSRVSQGRGSTAIASKPPTAPPRATDPELSASVASPTVAELRADDEGQESQIEGPRDCERKPSRPPPALQMAANMEIESSEASLNVSATSGFARTTVL